ncbi:hypothetical protein Q604_UNBC17888G0001, partial [human gut metagenome]
VATGRWSRPASDLSGAVDYTEDTIPEEDLFE